jgi:hypothetical protein
MPLQRIDTAFGPNPIRFNGNIQPQANANVFLGNTSFQFSTIYAGTFSGTSTFANLAYFLGSGTAIHPSSANVSGNIVGYATTVTANVSTGAIVSRGGLGVAGVGIFGGNLVAAATTVSTSTTTGALVVNGGIGVAEAIYNGGIQVSAGNIVAAATTVSTSATTGALVVGGGVGIAGNVNTSGWLIPTANITQNLGTTTNWWNVFYGVSTQARYADLAENYQADAAYEPGTVLEFGGEFEVTLAEDGTRRVAGVVSKNPAHLMNGGLTGANVVPVALQGRTPCKVRGRIRKGDMLISAGSGYARPDSSPQMGTVIGKALEDFDGVEGTVEVVVGRL